MSDETPLEADPRTPNLYDLSDLLIAATITLWVYIVPFDPSSAAHLQAIPGLIGLLFVPGYLTILSALTVTKLDVELDRLELLLLSFIISVTTIPILGMSLHFIIGSAYPETIVGIISVYVFISVSVHFIHRLASDSAHTGVQVNVRGFLSALFQQETKVDKALNMAIILLILVGTVAVIVPVPGQTSPQFTEISLLTENESGDLAMDGYLSDLNSTKSKTINTVISNNERRTVNYTLVVQVQRAELSGQSVVVRERRQVDRTGVRLSDNDSAEIPYQFTAREAQTGCRVAFLLYAGNVPPSPTMDNAYREVHVWHTDDPPAGKNGCADLKDISVRQNSSANVSVSG